MKKVLVMMFVMLVGMTASMKAQTWAQVGPVLANEVNQLGEYMSEAFSSQGIPTTATASFSQSNKSLDIVFDFGNLDIIPVLDNNILEETKSSFISSMIDSMRAGGSGEEVRTLADLMTKEGGTIRIIFKAAGKQKSISVSGKEILKAL